MKKRFLSILFAVLSAPFCWADAGGFEIKDLKFQGIVKEENVVSVVENIDVNFLEPRHGLYRSIPNFFHINTVDRDGYSLIREYVTKVRNIGVSGAPATSSTADSNTILKVGDENKTVKGPMSYAFSYDYCFPDDRSDDYDFFFYSVLGSEWDVPVEHFSFELIFENGIPEDTQFQLFSGEYGSFENGYDVDFTVDGNTVYGEVSNIPAHYAVTVFTYLPQGYFIEGKKVSPVPAWIFFILAVLTSVLMLFKMITVRQDAPVQTVEFHAPEGIAPAEVGTIVDNSADIEDLVSLIPWWGSKGYLKIENRQTDGFWKNEQIVLIKLKDLEEDSPEYQKLFFNALFADGDELKMSTLPKNFGNKATKAKEALGKEFDGERKLYKNEFLGIICTVICTVLMGLSMMLNSPVGYFYDGSLAVYPMIAMIVTSGFMMGARAKKAFNKKKILFATIGGILLNLLACLIFWVALSEYESFINWDLMMILMHANSVVAILSHRLIMMTDYNLEIAGKLLGLKEFIKTAELEKLRMLSDENPEYFYDILPYAMVFNLSTKWGDKFKDINLTKPDWWYDSTHTDDFMTATALSRSFTKSLDTAFNTLSSSISSSTAGSGSGGFSGGGGGGGGGGSW